MDFQDKQFVIGIDLGTTNSAVSYVDLAALRQSDQSDKKPFIKVFNIPQLTGHGEFTKIPVLPSFLYIPGEYDISKEVLKHPWKKREDLFAGSFARDHGSKIPSRLVSSAKSWLCNSRVDRKAKILPWGSEGVEKVSPVVTTSEYLLHIKSAWNHFVKDEDKFLENQFVVITVPASFDEEARDLTMEAINMAGFGNSVTLLEEPLAAFYSWLIHHETDWQQHVAPGELILVCDVGGGTTDFSLISLRETEGTPRFERIAVGEHLILGGDNIDLELARVVEAKFKSKTKLSSDKWKTLCHRCREAKERILENGESKVRITLKGEGRSLIAGTLSADLAREDVENVLINAFFRDVKAGSDPTLDSGKEILEFGLPFEKETAVTRHIIEFLEKHRDDVQKHLNKEPVPDYILFNGGTLKPDLVQQRIIRAIGNWFEIDKDRTLKILENQSPELAVGLGAAYYGLVKQGEGVRVGSGSPRSYYLGIAVENERTQKAICLVERGLDEGSQIDLPQMEFEVRTNEPVIFNIFSSSFRTGDYAGDIIDIDSTVTPMSPLTTIIKFGKKSEKKTIPVRLGADYTEMGTLAMHCRSGVSDHKWKLQFQLREQQSSEIAAQETEVYDQRIVNESADIIKRLLSDGSCLESDLNGIVKQIEKRVGQKKVKWPLSFLRTLADELISLAESRNLSELHEAKWLNLTGYCMRPGFGDAFDEDRARSLWRIYLSGLQYDKSKQNRLEWWIFLRRIAAGLKAGQQRQLFQDISPPLIKGKNSNMKISPQEQTEIWMTLGNMEKLLVKDKVVLAKSLIPVLKPGKNMDTLFWSLSRFGARELLYGSTDRVVPAKEVIRWFNRIRKIAWKPNDPVEQMVVQMTRKTGDRTRDIDPKDIPEVETWLKNRKTDSKLLKKLHEKIEVAMNEKSAQFGEKLPAGLLLKK